MKKVDPHSYYMLSINFILNTLGAKIEVINSTLGVIYKNRNDGNHSLRMVQFYPLGIYSDEWFHNKNLYRREILHRKIL